MSIQKEHGYVRTRPLVAANLRNKREFIEKLDETMYRWLRRLKIFFYAPFVVEHIYVRGYENLPCDREPGPVLAFSHKKWHDAVAVLGYMAGRPLERFHNATLVGQAGLFNAMYVYQDLAPDFLKGSFLQRPLVRLVKFLSRGVIRFMEVIHVHPVYRDADVPGSRDEYESSEFAGPILMGMDYEQFLKQASRVTRQSIICTQQEMERENYCFLIFPEGIYSHDGAVAEPQDLAGYAAFRKQRPVVYISLSYDELCLDRLRRVTCWIITAKPQAPPAHKDDIGDYLQAGREQLQRNTVITASNLIALTVRSFKKTKQFRRGDFDAKFHAFADLLVAGPFPFDPGLKNVEYRADRLRRFFRSHRFFFTNSRDRYSFNEERMAHFLPSERAVNDIDWNANNVRHAWDYLGGDAEPLF